MVTPLNDGMNLMAKEYCACQVDEDGILILSEFAGAVHEFHEHAILVNPRDIDALAEAMKQAFDMSEDEKHQRMRGLRRQVQSHDIFWWVDSFLKAAIEKDLSNFPLLDEYRPAEEL